MKVIYLIRGLPGSGKSTLASKITPHHYEADSFFICDDGIYRHNIEKIGEAHAQCQRNVEFAMEAEVSNIAVANTFVKQWELLPYKSMAVKYGYTVVEVTVKGLFENIHGVPLEVIERMKVNWEK